MYSKKTSLFAHTMSFEVALNDYWFEYGWGVTQSVGFKAPFRLSLKEDS
jgi:hypothetical protein